MAQGEATGGAGAARDRRAPGEVADIVARYREAGADEIIIPAFTLGRMARAKDTCDLFIEEVAPAFR